MRIGVDLDGVLANFESQFAPLLSSLSHIAFPLSDPNFPPVWDWPEHYGCSTAEVEAAWEIVVKDESFWARLAPFKDTTDADLTVLRHARAAGHEIYFITTRLGVRCKEQSERWLYMQGYTNPTVIVSRKKGPVAQGIELDLFVDDKPSNILEVQRHSLTTCYLLDRPYNKTMDHPRRVRSVREMLDSEGL